MEEKLTIGKFTMNKPSIYDPNLIKLEIDDYDYESTVIEMDDILKLRMYIDEILMTNNNKITPSDIYFTHNKWKTKNHLKHEINEFLSLKKISKKQLIAIHEILNKFDDE